MVKQHNQTQSVIGLFFDMICIGCAWLLAYFLRSLWSDVLTFYPKYFYALAIVLSVCFFVFKTLGAYSIQACSAPLPRVVWNVFYMSSVSFAMLLAMSFFYRSYEYSRIIAMLFWIFSIIFLTLSRVVMRWGNSYLLSNGFCRRTALIVGAGDLGRRVERALTRNPWQQVEVTGFVDDRSNDKDCEVKNISMLGEIGQLKQIIEESRPDYLYIALPFVEYDKIQKIMEQMTETVVSVRMVADIFSLPTLRSGISDWLGFPLIHITDSPLDEGWNRFLKRIFDMIFALMALVFLSPLMIFIAIGVKLSSHGKILYRQSRMGLDGNNFNMLKFRTMPENAEAATGPVWATHNDHRPTRFGSFLRKTSFDELPQFWNVLMGNMSVVGPRPERPVFIEKFKKEIPKYMLRHKMKAGITGWAQVNGWRGDTSLKKRIEHDLYYIENWSFALDLKIVFLTVIRGLVNKNAY